MPDNESAFGHTDPNVWKWNEKMQRFEYVGENRVIILLKGIWAWAVLPFGLFYDKLKFWKEWYFGPEEI